VRARGKREEVEAVSVHSLKPSGRVWSMAYHQGEKSQVAECTANEKSNQKKEGKLQTAGL